MCLFAKLFQDSPATDIYVVRASHGLSWVNFAELWAYRELIYFLAWRDVKVRYKQTLVGVAWVLLQPLAMMAIFYLLFDRLVKIPSDGMPYPLFVLAGLLPWQFFSRVISESTNSLITDQRLITRVYFPRLVVPIATAVAALVDFGLALCLLVLMMFIFGVMPGMMVLLMPILILLMLAAALGVGFWLSALNVEYRDVMHAVPFLNQLWFFATPVVYSTTLLPEQWRFLYGFNPMIAVVEGFRWSLLGRGQFSLMSAMSAMVAVILFVTGMIWFRSRERRFVDALGSPGG